MSAELLVFSHWQYLIYGFVGVAFTHDFWFSIGLPLLIGAIVIYPAFFLELTPTFQYVWSVRMPMELFLGAGLGVFFVQGVASPRLINTHILLHGNEAGRMSRFSPLTVHGVLNLGIIFTAIVTVAGVFYWVKAYDTPTLGLAIGNGANLAPVVGPVATLVGLALLGVWYAIMSIMEKSGVGATSAKYYVALPFLLLPIAILDLGVAPYQYFDSVASGGIALAITILMWALFYVWAIAVNFKPTISPTTMRIVDPLYRNHLEAARFLIVGVVHVSLVAIGWVAQISTSGDAQFDVAYYGAIIAGAVLLIVFLLVGLSNRAWVLEKYATWQGRVRIAKGK